MERALLEGRRQAEVEEAGEGKGLLTRALDELEEVVAVEEVGGWACMYVEMDVCVFAYGRMGEGARLSLSVHAFK